MIAFLSIAAQAVAEKILGIFSHPSQPPLPPTNKTNKTNKGNQQQMPVHGLFV
jgi:hypothetical protein